MEQLVDILQFSLHARLGIRQAFHLIPSLLQLCPLVLELIIEVGQFQCQVAYECLLPLCQLRLELLAIGLVPFTDNIIYFLGHILRTFILIKEIQFPEEKVERNYRKVIRTEFGCVPIRNGAIHNVLGEETPFLLANRVTIFDYLNAGF